MTRGAAFAWVSLLDVLFALFGGLVVLTVIISAKLGSVSPIVERPYHAVTVQVTARGAEGSKWLEPLFLAFAVFTDDGTEACWFDGRHPDGGCVDEFGQGGTGGDRPARVASGVDVDEDGNVRLTATLLVTAPMAGDGAQELRVMPLLGNIARLWDAKAPRNHEFAVRINVKSHRAVWNVASLGVTVGELLDREGGPAGAGDLYPRPRSGAAVLPPETAGRVEPADDGCRVDCSAISVEQGGLVRVSWR